MRARKKKWAPAELENNPYILRGATYAECTPQDDPRPLHVEIGCGKGRFIVTSAARHPHIRHVAIEREPVILAAAARKALETFGPASGPALSPGFVLLDVQPLATFFAPGDITRLYINFCDPWPGKKKRAKRRLTHANFLDLYRQLAIPEVHFKTDNRGLFEFSLESFSHAGWHMQNISLDLHHPMPPDNIVTEYEEKFSPHGPIYRLEATPPGGVEI